MTKQGERFPRTVRAVATALRRRYRDFAHYNKRDPYRELVFISCSTLTQEPVYRRVYASFISSFPTAESASRASIRELREVLDEGGLGKRKAHLIKSLFLALIKTHGTHGLRKMEKLDDEPLESALLGLPGIGKKIARCVMLYSYDRQAFPVDTHCWRMAKRLGWIRGRALTPKKMDTLQEKIPPGLRLSLHVNMVSHGREICRAKNPRCEHCVIGSICPKIGVRSRRRG